MHGLASRGPGLLPTPRHRTTPLEFPALTKARTINDSNAILLPLNYDHHFLTNFVPVLGGGDPVPYRNKVTTTPVLPPAAAGLVSASRCVSKDGQLTGGTVSRGLLADSHSRVAGRLHRR